MLPVVQSLTPLIVLPAAPTVQGTMLLPVVTSWKMLA